MFTQRTFRRLRLSWLIPLIALAVVLMVSSAGPLQAQTSPITLISGNGQVGTLDPLNQSSVDGGATWQQARIIAKYPIWCLIAGTQCIYCGPNFADLCGINTTTRYRTTFILPAGFSSPSLVVDVHADNAARIFLNGVQIGQHACFGTFSCGGASFQDAPETFSTNNPVLFQAGSNILEFHLWDFGIAAGLDYKATVSFTPDTTPPTVACNANPNRLWPPDHKMIPITASVTVTDPLSGPAGFKLTAVTCNEPDEGLGDGDMPNDIQGWDVGTPDTSGMLRAERSGKGTGRVYTLSYMGFDGAGNSSSCSTTVTVPHDQGK